MTPPEDYREAMTVVRRLTTERDALARFKAYVHERLSHAGVPIDPPSEHRAKGCRIGGRLDWLLAHRAAAHDALMRSGFTPTVGCDGPTWRPPVNEAAGANWRKLIDTEKRLATAEKELAAEKATRSPPRPEEQANLAAAPVVDLKRWRRIAVMLEAMDQEERRRVLRSLVILYFDRDTTEQP